MLGKPEWFERRKYGGWGLQPKTWQGWVYLACILIPFVVFQAMPYWDMKLRIIVTICWVVFLLIDVTHIMICLRRDERESKIEAFAERNAAWFMMLVLVVGVLYQAITSALNQQLTVDWFLVTALLGGALVKTISNIYLERKAI
jgi:hypothetical protein